MTAIGEAILRGDRSRLRGIVAGLTARGHSPQDIAWQLRLRITTVEDVLDDLAPPPADPVELHYRWWSALMRQQAAWFGARHEPSLSFAASRQADVFQTAADQHRRRPSTQEEGS
jgi:hypothetical protein